MTWRKKKMTRRRRTMRKKRRKWRKTRTTSLASGSVKPILTYCRVWNAEIWIQGNVN